MLRVVKSGSRWKVIYTLGKGKIRELTFKTREFARDFVRIVKEAKRKNG